MPLPAGIQGWSLCGLVMLMLGSLLHVIGLATPDWSVGYPEKSSPLPKISVGLWEVCMSFCQALLHQEKSEIWKTCDALAIVGMLFSFLSVGAAAYVMYLKVKAKPDNESLVKLSTAMSILSLLSILICTIMWSAGLHPGVVHDFWPGTRHDKIFEEGPDIDHNTLGYSFILSILGGCLLSIGGVIFSCSLRK
ncbi:uncharacterized protein LOC131946975 [Physella acuta]|uniref:uncharacterized protein LOC131946975 n=1 Tax=Physella acuta TaxID=109671 RepID=UPI0027DDC0A5|nr:uncharacterized protein LOC131946975 [Physella acuta]